MERLKYPFSHEWHVAINRHSDDQRVAGKPWEEMRFMYEAKKAADEVPRMIMLFKAERTDSLPIQHKQCSMQPAVPVPNNHLSCCLGVKAKECPHLLSLEKIERVTADDIDAAKAWTCAAHIIASGGDWADEGYMLRVDDRMYWDAVHASLAADEDDPA